MLIAYAFWHHIAPPLPLRDHWFWLLWCALPIFGLRLRLFGYLWTHTPLHDVMILLIMVTAFNYMNAPLHRESYLAVMARPLFGMWLAIYLIELARYQGRLQTLFILTCGMAGVLALLALTATQWHMSKSGALWVIIERLPHFDFRAVPWDQPYCGALVQQVSAQRCFSVAGLLRQGLFSFNPNEIAGALVWVAPMMAGFATLRQDTQAETSQAQRVVQWIIVIWALILFALLTLALVLGQSRFALIGLLVSLVIVAWFGLPRGRKLALAGIALAMLLQLGLVLGMGRSADAEASLSISARDQSSLSSRVAIWERSLWMLRDYPATGVGMYLFRTWVDTETYQVPSYVERNLPPPPHAHNEWLHIGAELGLPGVLVFISLQAVAVWMLWRGWQAGNATGRTMALAVFAGLLAHMIFGLGDAIALWDRYQFLLWWLLGLAGAQFVLSRQAPLIPAIL